MNSKSFCALAVGVLLLGAAAAVVVAPHVHQPAPGARLAARWAHDYRSLDEITRDVDAVVLATVTAVRAGRTAKTLPFTLVDMEVDSTIRGEAGEVITLEQTGGDLDGTPYMFNDDGGPYEIGEQVLLFLNRQPDTEYYYLVHPKGRFHVDAEDGSLAAVVPDDPVAAELNEKSVKSALRLLSHRGE
jgi:hypothetical protein